MVVESPDMEGAVACRLTVSAVVVLQPVPDTTMSIVFEPTSRSIGFDALPDATTTPSTSTDAPGSLEVGVTVIEDCEFGTESENANVSAAKDGERLPADALRAESAVSTITELDPELALVVPK